VPYRAKYLIHHSSRTCPACNLEARRVSIFFSGELDLKIVYLEPAPNLD